METINMIELLHSYKLASQDRIATFLQFNPVVKLTASFPMCLAAVMIIIYITNSVKKTCILYG